MKQKKIVKNKGDSKITNNGTINHVKFMDRKEVNIITTFHTAEIVDTGKLDKKTKEPIMKYAAVHDYNKYMGAVDLSDQFLTYTAVKRRTIKWWKKVFLHLFALSEVNTYLFYKETMKRKANIKYMDHKSFRKELCKDMTSLMPMKPLSPRLRNACVGETDVRLSSKHFPEPLPIITKNGKNYTTRRKCFVCMSINQRKDVSFECAACKKPLCVSPCFRIYHTHTDYKRERARCQ